MIASSPLLPLCATNSFAAYPATTPPPRMTIGKDFMVLDLDLRFGERLYFHLSQLPAWRSQQGAQSHRRPLLLHGSDALQMLAHNRNGFIDEAFRSEERRVGKECSPRRTPCK